MEIVFDYCWDEFCSFWIIKDEIYVEKVEYLIVEFVLRRDWEEEVDEVFKYVVVFSDLYECDYMCFVSIK